MKWYKGNIAEAVALSKTKNAIFVVYVEGKDEATTKLGNFINDSRIREILESDDFVAIKIEGDSEPYMQFASIYQIVPVPSIFFIGKAGTPLDITTGVINSVEELEGKIEKVLQLSGKTTTVTTASSSINNFIKEEAKASSSQEAQRQEETKASSSQQVQRTEEDEEISSGVKEAEIVCEGGVCFKKPLQDEEKPKEVSELQEVEKKKQQDEEAKLAETRKYLEQKRRERIEEEKRLEKERELQRRKEGKEIQNLRNWQKDQELKELKENIKRERLEEQKARERIRAQIAADKAERAHKFATENQAAALSSAKADNSTDTTHAPSTSATATASDESRLQFRLASGASNTQNFKCSSTLAEIREYVTRELLPGTGIKEFTLATTYPKRELTNEHNSKTLLELELFPSAVILIIGKEATGPTAIISRNGGLINMFSLLVMTILSPILSLFNMAKNWLTGKNNAGGVGSNASQTGAQKRSNEEQSVQNDVSKRRNIDRFLSGSSGNTSGSNNQNEGNPGANQGSAYRRYVGGSNIHRLSDSRKDSDDENATWNGNSTQQQ